MKGEVKNENRNEIKKYFDNMSNEEFRKLLESVGFEVEDGDGKIIFTEEIIFEGVVVEYLDDNGNERNEILSKDKTTYDGDDFEYDLSQFKNKKVKISIETV